MSTIAGIGCSIVNSVAVILRKGASFMSDIAGVVRTRTNLDALIKEKRQLYIRVYLL